MRAANLLPAEQVAVGEIQALVDRFTAAWEKLDANEVLSTVAQRDDMIMFGTDEVEYWVGFNSLVKPFEAMVKVMGQPHYAWGLDEPHVWTHGNTGCASGILTLTFEDNGEHRRILMRSTFVAIKLDQGWSIAHAHFSVGE